jgi:hypothetical protein
MGNLFKKWSQIGVMWPFVHDGSTKKPSITIAFAYVSYLMVVISVVCLHFKPELLTATLTTISVWLAAVVFYMLRKLTKAKVDLDDRSFELDGGDDTPSQAPKSPTKSSSDDSIGS